MNESKYKGASKEVNNTENSKKFSENISELSNSALIEDPFGGEKAVPCEIENNSTNPDEDDGEDLPDNFFDDFSNNDFMAGLDIVDDWINEDVEEGSKHDREKKEIPKEYKTRDKSPYKSHRDKYELSKTDSHYRSRRRYSREGDRYARDHYRKRSRSRNRRRSRSRHHDKVDKSVSDASKEKSDSIAEARRDPEKTKRDIQRDKIRCVKDQEARVFQEQLKVAETGLVPPGTELDVVLNSEKFKTEKLSEKVEPEIKKDKPKEEIKKDTISEKKKIDRSRSHSRDRRRRRSPEYSRTERDRSYSPKRRRRTLLRERDPPRRSHSRKRREDSREIDLRYRIKEKRERCMAEFSPVSDKQLSRSPSIYNISPESLISEREAWIRDRAYHSRSRHNRSCSPVSSLNFSDAGVSPKRPKKFSFMEEIEIKLRQKPVSNIINEIKPVPPPLMSLNQPLPLMGMPTPNPQPLPLMGMPASNPQAFIPQPMPFQPNPGMFGGVPPTMCPPPDPYQHQMMMGPGDPNFPPHLMGNPAPMVPMHPPHVMPNMAPAMVPFPAPQGPAPPNLMYNSAQFRTQSNLKDCHAEGNQELEKLFEDKKISLSDFLSVSAKPIDPSTPVSIHNKIKVISRCQETIKLLEDPKLTGRFFPKLSQMVDSEKCVEKSANQSPMRKAVVVRFNFTIPVNKLGPNKYLNHSSVSTYMHKILSQLGIAQVVTSAPRSEDSPKEPTALGPKLVPLSAPAVIKKRTIFSQTEPFKCQVCETRSARKYTDIQTQTVETSTFDVGTQVSVEDLNKSYTTFVPRGILKNPVQSISHLTPAQLLAQVDNEKKEENSNKPWSNMPKKDFSNRGYSDSSHSHLPGQNFAESTPRNLFGSSSNDRFNDSYRNINSFNDSYSGGDHLRNQNKFGGGNQPLLGKAPGDTSFGSSYLNNPFNTSEINRADFTNTANRNTFGAQGGNFGSPGSDIRNFDSSFGGVRRFSENVNSNFGNRNPSAGRGRGFPSNIPMQNNNFFNPRGAN